ncbi:5-carboxymethyl-2-hydroxymuconate Delta-isomerase [Shewanella maritima]|uniref:5-carboxymethyl-2-hydroxymuconate Delta-isomerase n=1 Tax=Shewanella maritima TaxID=2520507 RepID=UPI003736B5F5
MPHFIIDCSEDVLDSYAENFILEQVFHVANDTGLFDPKDIKVRLNPYSTYTVNNQQQGFIHVFAHIMQGRNTQQKAHLSQQIVSKLVQMFPEFETVSMNITDFDKASYCNKASLSD